MHLSFQKVKEKIVWGSYIDWDKKHFFPLYSSYFLINQFIFCKEEVVATHV